MKKLIILICTCFLFFNNVSAQEQKADIKPLHKFMQINADSTLVIQYTSGWSRSPNYYLLSKKGDTVTAYTYKDAERNFNIQVPEKIRTAMYEVRQSKITTVPVDVNEFFTIYPMESDCVLEFWTNLNAIKPWTIRDDKVDGEHCPPVKKDGKDVFGYRIYDAENIKIYLITKDKIKTLDFYAPDFYEEQCPGRPGRIAVLKIKSLFATYFK